MAEEIVEPMVLKGILSGALGAEAYSHCRVYDAENRLLRVQPTPRWLEDALGTRGPELTLRARIDPATREIAERSLAVRWADSAGIVALRDLGSAGKPIEPDPNTWKALAEWNAPRLRWSAAAVARLEREGASPSDNMLHIMSIESRATEADLATVLRFTEHAEMIEGSFSQLVRHFAMDLETLPNFIRAQAPSWVTCVKVSEMTNAEGEPALRVTLLVEPRHEALQDGGQLEAAVDAVHHVFRHMSVDRWPYTRFVSADEAA